MRDVKNFLTLNAILDFPIIVFYNHRNFPQEILKIAI